MQVHMRPIFLEKMQQSSVIAIEKIMLNLVLYQHY